MSALHDYRVVLPVTTLSAAFGCVLVLAPLHVATALAAAGLGGATVDLLLGVVSFLFLCIALFVGSLVTSTSCSTLLAGRTKELALQRLLGADASYLRRRIARAGLLVGGVGGLVGSSAGSLVTALTVIALRQTGVLPAADYSLAAPQVLLPLAAVALSTWAAFVTASRSVLGVTPLQALGAAVEPSRTDLRAGTGRRRTAVVLMVTGGVLIAVGLVGSFASPVAVIPTVFGIFASFTGVVVGSPLVIAPLLRLVGATTSRGAAGLLARRTALSAPVRTSRATVGVLIGVTLLVTFSVALAAMQSMLDATLGTGPDDVALAGQQHDLFFRVTVVVGVLVGFSAVLAATGVVNAMSLSVGQRRGELSLLRVLGLSSAQVRRMITLEALHMVAAATVAGLALGILYGWAGAQSLLGSFQPAPFVVPPVTVAVVAVAVVVVALVATLRPVRDVLRTSPVAALTGR
jgi:putative ABC transport system permease protein